MEASFVDKPIAINLDDLITNLVFALVTGIYA